MSLTANLHKSVLASRCVFRAEAFQIEIQKPRVGSFIRLGEWRESLFVIEVKRICICVNRDEAATRLAVVPVRSDNHVDEHRANALAAIPAIRRQAAYLQCRIALEHLALGEELLAETIVCGIAREISQRYSVMRQTEIADHALGLGILKNIAGGKTHTIVQWSVREDEIVQVLIPTVKLRDNIVLAKPTNLQVGRVHRVRKNS